MINHNHTYMCVCVCVGNICTMWFLGGTRLTCLQRMKGF